MDLFKVVGYAVTPYKCHRAEAKAEEYYFNEDAAKNFAKSWLDTKSEGPAKFYAAVHIYKYTGQGNGRYEFNGEIEL